MTFIKIRNHTLSNGKTRHYYYQCQSYRNNEKNYPQQKVKYIGKSRWLDFTLWVKRRMKT